MRDILIDQTRALRKRWLIAEFEAGRKRGAYWGIGTAMDDYAANAANEPTRRSATRWRVPTRLSKFDADRQGHLINWGYALCDVSLRARVGLPIPMATAWPVPEWPL